MSNFRELDEQWRQRSEQMFRRCLKELDVTKARRAWYAAYQSEQRRLEWKSLCLQREGKIKTSTAADGERALFNSFSYQHENLAQEYINSSCKTGRSSS